MTYTDIAGRLAHARALLPGREMAAERAALALADARAYSRDPLEVAFERQMHVLHRRVVLAARREIAALENCLDANSAAAA
jgi:hypothetical protein